MYQYPIARKRPQEVTYGSHSLTDEFEWMRDAADEETVQYTSAQNAFTDKYYEEHREVFEKYMEEQRRLSETLIFKDVIRTKGGISALAAQADGVSRTVLLRDDLTVEKVITDEKFMEGLNVYGITPNPVKEHICLLHVLRDKAERTSGFVYDMHKKKVLAELRDTFSLAWSTDGAYAYYCRAAHREDGTVANTLCRYEADTGEDRELYTYRGHAAYGEVTPLDEGGVVVNFLPDYHAGEVVIFDSEGNVTEIPYDGNAREYIGTIGDRHFFMTDEDAELGKIIALKKGSGLEDAVTYIGETDEKISGAAVNRGKVICIYENAGSQRLCIFDENKEKHEVVLPCRYGKIDIAEQEYKDVKPLFSYESFSVPPCVMELDMESYQVRIVYRSGEACSDVVEELTDYRSRDGVCLKAYIVHKAGVRKNGENRALFYGYGGYNATNYVSSGACGMSLAEWLESGGVYVHCIIRGGGEFGETWHRGGWKENKKNVFHDFCDIVEGVIADNWTNPSRIAICGLSNGGLLMTALITERPDLFGCVIASVPHTDMLGFVYDDRGSMYITEYGDPRENDMFGYMKSYSPYHNVRQDAAYPGIYIQAGEMDNNVPAYHAKKFAAKMQGVGGERPVLLRVLPFGSHDQGTGKYYQQTIAEMRTFIDIELS